MALRTLSTAQVTQKSNYPDMRTEYLLSTAQVTQKAK